MKVPQRENKTTKLIMFKEIKVKLEISAVKYKIIQLDTANLKDIKINSRAEKYKKKKKNSMGKFNITIDTTED